jgi:hypothetical protein
VTIIGRPPGLAVGHHLLEVFLQGPIIERVEGLGIVEVGSHRIRRQAALERSPVFASMSESLLGGMGPSLP